MSSIKMKFIMHGNVGHVHKLAAPPFYAHSWYIKHLTGFLLWGNIFVVI
jgi:hypothetical protein